MTAEGGAPGGSVRPPEIPSSLRAETAAALGALVAGVLPRLLFVRAYPVAPMSDFAAMVKMATALRDHAPEAARWGWFQLSAGAPTLLSMALRLAPGSPATAARIATAIWTGLAPLTAFLVLGRPFSLRFRLAAAAGLAFWPGQIVFSGVVSQDNWIVLPVVASAALGVRALREGAARPLLAALFYASAVWIREEMLVVLVPPAVVAAAGPRTGRRRMILRFALAASLLLGLICWQRGRATGRYTVRSELGWEAPLGTYAPGAGLGFVLPRAFLSSVDPALLKDRRRALALAPSLVFEEVRRRPFYHAVRRIAATLLTWQHAELEDLYWAFPYPDPAAPPGASARRFAARAGPWLDRSLALVHVAFLAAVLLGLSSGSREVTLLTVTIAAKVGVQLLFVSMGRFFLPVEALELLTIPFGVEIALRRRRAAVAVGGAAVFAAAIAASARAMGNWALAHEDVPQRIYRFSISGPGRAASLDCIVAKGWVSDLGETSARLQLLRRDPRPGEVARADCRLLPGSGAGPVALEIRDGYAKGGLPNQIVQRVRVDGREELAHDISDVPGEGWLAVPLPAGSGGAPPRVTIEIDAVRPFRGGDWGDAGATDFRLAPADRTRTNRD
ncbi:MAG TPA: hypothetical protein VFS34_07080 [Thermoanaerobaculia bacterium]|nr:hypothetical protein [Thermoanaerobaculia bacterium]